MELFPEDLTEAFEFKGHLNFGGYGTIYRAIKRSNFYSGNGQMYAIKAVALTSTGSSWKDIGAELQVLSWNNPYKLRLDSFFVKDETFYMVIDYCRNGDLLKAIVDKIQAHEIFEEDEIWKYFIQICFGLESLHNNGFIHRDLHPQNILLDENKDIKIADFGTSRSFLTKTIQGVASCQSPRTHSGHPQTKESDVWAVGCILYYLCNLEHPFGDNVNKIKNEPHKPIKSEYSNELRDFVDWCLQKRRKERPTIVDILAHEFIINKTLSLGITIPQTSAMNAAIWQVQFNKERERNEQLEKELSKYRKKNKVKEKEIESLRAEIAHLKSIINGNKKSDKDLKDSNEDLLNSQTIKINQDLSKVNEFIKSQMILQELREKRSEILNRPNDPELEQEFRRTCSKFSSDVCVDQQAYQDYTNAYRQKTSLYTIRKDNKRTNLIIYDTENDSKEERILETPEKLDSLTCIAQLPNSNLFWFCNFPPSGVSLIIDENYRVRQLPSGTPCSWSSAIYFNNSVYCFGGQNKNYEPLILSERFDLNENRWIKLKPLPQADLRCTSVIFNRNIVISGCENKNLLRYSIDSNTFATILYDFQVKRCKILISVERLYLIECGDNGSIYESELSNDTAWRRIGDSIIGSFSQVYLSYNKGGINIARCCGINPISYFKFNLEAKRLTKLD